jgi:hypothetical protein
MSPRPGSGASFLEFRTVGRFNDMTLFSRSMPPRLPDVFIPCFDSFPSPSGRNTASPPSDGMFFTMSVMS